MSADTSGSIPESATGPLQATDDLDMGFDALINRYGTHRLLDADALSRLRPDLSRIIAPPEVTFAAYLADGSIVLCCPDGVPESLAEVVETLDHTEPVYPTPPQPLAHVQPGPDVADRLDALSAKLDLMQRDHALGAQIAGRLEEVRTTLLEGLAKATPVELPPLLPTPPLQMLDTENLIGGVGAQVHHMLRETEARVLSHLRNATRAPASQMTIIEQRLNALVASSASQPALEAQLARIEGQLEGLVHRPAPLRDLAAQRQGVAYFLESMSSVLRRLDTAINRLETPADPVADPVLPALYSAIEGISKKLDTLPTAPDLSPLQRMLDTLRDEIRQTGLAAQPQADAIQTLAQRIDALARRPDPVLDLTPQRQSFARFSEAMAHVLQRLEATAETLAARPDDTSLIPETHALHCDVRQSLANSATQAEDIAALHEMVAELANRASPTLDLSAQRKSFAQFATALSQALRQLEERSQNQQALVQDLQATATEAILGLMLSQSLASGTSVQTDADDPVLEARWRLAEAMAAAFKLRGWSPAL